MELIRRITGALRHLQKKKLADSSSDEFTSTFEEKQIELTDYLDSYEKNHELIDHQILRHIAETVRNKPEQLYEFFSELCQKGSWMTHLSLSELSVQYDSAILDEKMLRFSRTETIHQQIFTISEAFSELNPTNLELLAMLLDGDPERFPQAATEKIRALIERETAARTQLEKLLRMPWNDQVRWWLVKSVTNLSPAARNFIQQTAKGRKDLRLNAMILIMLLKNGLEWAARYPAGLDKTVAELFFSQTYHDRIVNLVKLLPE